MQRWVAQEIPVHRKQYVHEFNALSLFTGAGGFDCGFEYNGVRTTHFVEFDNNAANTFSANFDSELLGSDITGIGNKVFRQVDADIVFGGPPCQGFSTAGKREVFDPRNQLYKHFARAVSCIRPKAFVLENVVGMLDMRTPDGSLLINDLLSLFTRLGYVIKHKVLNAANYGAPQLRYRLIFIGIRKDLGITPVHPRPTHLPTTGLRLPRYRVLGDIFHDLPALPYGAVTDDPLHYNPTFNHGHIKRAQTVKPGGWIVKSNGFKVYRRQRLTETSHTLCTRWTITYDIHPVEDRCYSLRELSRIQGFADDFIFYGPTSKIAKQLGNAVSPHMSFAIAKQLTTQLKGK